MPKENKDKVPQNVSPEELRTIIHGLKMSGFSFVDKDAIEQIELKIKNLPTPEVLMQIGSNPKELKAVIKEVGEIMRLVEIYGTRGPEYRARHKSKTKLPPRYKVLEWRTNMNKASLIKELVKVSDKADKFGKSAMASKLIACAKKVRDDVADIKDFEDIEKEMKLSGMDKELALMKEAGFMDVMKGIGNVGKDVGKAVSDKAKQVGQSIAGSFNVGVYKSKLSGIHTKLQEITKELNTIVGEATKAANSAQEPHKTKLTNIVNQLNALYSSNEATSKKATEVVSSVTKETTTTSTPPATTSTPPATTGTPPATTADVAAPTSAAGAPQQTAQTAQTQNATRVQRPYSLEGLKDQTQIDRMKEILRKKISAKNIKFIMIKAANPSLKTSIDAEKYLESLTPEQAKEELAAIEAQEKTLQQPAQQSQPQAQTTPATGAALQQEQNPEALKFLSGLKKVVDDGGDQSLYENVNEGGQRYKIVRAFKNNKDLRKSDSEYKITRIA